MDWAEGANRKSQTQRKQSRKRKEPNGNDRASDADLSFVQTENPHGQGGLEPTMKRARDPIEFLFSKGNLDDAQHKAAHIIRRAVEGMGQCSSIDPARIRVDGGGAGDPALYILEATRTLEKAREAIQEQQGKEGWDIVRRIAGEGMTISHVAIDHVLHPDELKNGGVSKQARDYVSRVLRKGLDHVAEAFGLIVR